MPFTPNKLKHILLLETCYKIYHSMSPFDYHLFYQRHLPHYQPPGATFFITFRLAGSLPAVAIQRLTMEKQLLEREIETISDPGVRGPAIYKLQKRLFAKWDAELHASKYPDWLSNPDVAQLIADNMHNLDEQLYTLEAYCVMPNHIHMVCTPYESENGSVSLARIMQLLKGRTSRQANLLLGRNGAFWQHESYDHVVRDNLELERIIQYVINNPGKAALPGNWVYCRTNFSLSETS